MTNNTPFQKVLTKFRKYSFSEKDKGDRFERLMQAFLQTDPNYAYKFKHVWLWNDFPSKKDFGGKDIGIDIVALTHDGDYWSIQCKCYQETTTIDKPAVDSFLSTSSKSFLDENLKSVHFTQCLWISTTNKWGPNAEEAIHNQKPPVTRLNLYELEQALVDWEKLENGIYGEQSRLARKSIRPHQSLAITNTHDHFLTSDRGKLIMACGTGKTFTSLKIAENETNGNGLVLFLVPSIALLSQTLREWTAEAYEYIVNGKSAIEWIMERYQITTHKESGIKNNPNDWATEVNNPRYILDLLLSIINVSMQTVEIVKGLPSVKFE